MTTSLKKRKRDILNGFQEHCIQMFAKDKEGFDHLEETDPWTDDYCYIEMRLEEKIIVKALIDGILDAHRWSSDLFEPPEGFKEVLTEIGRNVQTLRFGFPDGKIRMSINDLVDRHMRLWIATNPCIQKWSDKGLLTLRSILRNACSTLIMHQQAFDYHFKKMRKDAIKEINGQLADASLSYGSPDDSGAFPPLPSSGFLKAVDISPATPQPPPPPPEKKTPSGLQPSL